MAKLGNLNLRNIISPSALDPQAVKMQLLCSPTGNDKLLAV